MESDAYATGQALYALNVGRQMAVQSRLQKGIDYLLRTQAADGTWHVESRSIWLQPYFESGFPYGHDQFISAAGTGWAVMALAPRRRHSGSLRRARLGGFVSPRPAQLPARAASNALQRKQRRIVPGRAILSRARRSDPDQFDVRRK